MHAPVETNPADPAPMGSSIDPRAVKILARSIFRDMKEYGLANERIVEVASELIGLVAQNIEKPEGD